ncbi:MAG TPA: DnaJ domain-containing protein [Casimicrobiaceae bacterium]|nr:DnaJ domain-containing protein [Casimicrobiaceae bacterium]
MNGIHAWHGCCSIGGGWRHCRRIGQEKMVNYTHYDYLELPPCATTQRIEAAYAALLERFQYGKTDAGQDLSGLVRMIHAAYSVLSDPDQRRAYDAALSQEAAAADAELQAQLDAQSLSGFTRVQKVPESLAARIPELAA